MAFPLAHDDEGLPVEVPPVAVGWLVRRHGGGKGRPGAVYDGEGRPLVVELDATTTDLRTLGCRPGSYRLDAVDDARKPLGVTAYTEVATDEGGEDGEAGAAGADAAVAALARAVEAMQRVQAERERVQAVMFQKLIDRIAPAPARPADDLRNMVMQVLDLRKDMRNEIEEEAGTNEEDEDEEDIDEEDDDENEEKAAPDQNALMATLVGLLTQYLPLLAARFVQPNAPAPATAAQAVPEAAPAVDAPTPVPAAAEVASAARAARNVSGPNEVWRRTAAKQEDFYRKIDAVFEQLTPEEQAKANTILKELPKDVMLKIGKRLGAMPVEQAVAEARRMLMAAPQNGTDTQEGGS